MRSGNWGSFIVWLVFVSYIFIAVAADFLASDQPIFFRNDEGRSWPVLTDKTSNVDWKLKPALQVVYPPVAFDPNRTDIKARYLPPFSKSIVGETTFVHWLGTDRLGRDVAAGMIHGCRKSLLIGFISMLVAAIVGIIVGSGAGFFGNERLGFRFLDLIILLVVIFYLIYLAYYHLIPRSLAGILLCGALGVFSFMTRNRKHATLPLDNITMRTIEIFSAVPPLLVLMALSSVVVTPTLWVLALLIGLLRWDRFALFVRSEVQKIAARDYVLAARIGGFTERSVLWKIIIPESLPPVVVVFTFGVASTILLESTLSFLGIGVPMEENTWGSILGQARQNLSAWWLAVFPGLAILILVLVLNHIGETLRRKLQHL